MQRLWGGRFEDSLSNVALEISESISFDQQLYREDIEASTAHAQMLGKCGIIPAQSAVKIIEGLAQILGEIEAGKMIFSTELEDIHTHIEKRLIELVGDDGKRLHTGRSRNDQVAVATHLHLKKHIVRQQSALRELLAMVISTAEKQGSSIWPGYTHTQIGQPVLLAHYLMTYFWMFWRDLGQLESALKETDQNPLGAGALAGANYPIDRQETQKALGFSSLYHNSIDAVSDRDYQLSYHFFCARFFVHISRFCEEMVWFHSQEISYVKQSDKITTGSSIMPQKKNPDICELLRGKSARAIANLQSLLINLKGLPLSYNRDLQEDKLYLFASIRLVDEGIFGIKEVFAETKFFPEKAVPHMRKAFAQATDIADFLVSECGLPFRIAHEVSGKLVLFCEKSLRTLDSLTSDEAKSLTGYDIPEKIFLLEKSVERKQGIGSTHPKEVEKQIAEARRLLTKE